jgi:hypothetical protein
MAAATRANAALRAEAEESRGQVASSKAALDEANARAAALALEAQVQKEASDRMVKALKDEHERALDECKKSNENTIARLRDIVDEDEVNRLRADKENLERLLQNAYGEMASLTEKLDEFITFGSDTVRSRDAVAAVRQQHEENERTWKERQAVADRRVRELEDQLTAERAEVLAQNQAREARAAKEAATAAAARAERVRAVEDVAKHAQATAALKAELQKAVDEAASLRKAAKEAAAEADRVRAARAQESTAVAALQTEAAKRDAEVALLTRAGAELSAAKEAAKDVDKLRQALADKEREWKEAQEAKVAMGKALADTAQATAAAAAQRTRDEMERSQAEDRVAALEAQLADAQVPYLITNEPRI